MYFSDFEKKAIDKILSGEIEDAFTYYIRMYHEDIKEYHNPGNLKCDDGIFRLWVSKSVLENISENTEYDTEMKIIYTGDKKLIEIFEEFLNLIYRLHEKHLIIFLYHEYQYNISVLMKYCLRELDPDKIVVDDERQLELLFSTNPPRNITSLRNIKILKTPELEQMVNKNKGVYRYLTREEVNIKKTQRRGLWANLITGLFAFISILVSIVFSIITYKNDIEDQYNTNLYNQRMETELNDIELRIEELNKSVENIDIQVEIVPPTLEE